MASSLPSAESAKLQFWLALARLKHYLLNLHWHNYLRIYHNRSHRTTKSVAYLKVLSLKNVKHRVKLACINHHSTN